MVSALFVRPTLSSLSIRPRQSGNVNANQSTLSSSSVSLRWFTFLFLNVVFATSIAESLFSSESRHQGLHLLDNQWAENLSRGRSAASFNDALRRLAIGDFDELNQRWDTIFVLELNSTSVQDEILGFPLTLDLSDIVCRKLSIGDIEYTWNRTGDFVSSEATTLSSTTELASELNVVNFTIDCTLNYTFSYTILNGAGAAEISIGDSALDTSFSLSLPEEVTETNPAQFSFDSCNPTIIVKDLSFIDGSPSDRVLNVLSGLLQDTIGNQIEGQMCTILEELEGKFRVFLLNLTDTLAGDGTIAVSLVSYEESMMIPDEINLFEFQDSRGRLANLFNTFNKLITMSNSTSTGSDNKNGTAGEDSNSTGFFSSLFGSDSSEGITIDLRNNALLNGEDGFLASLTKNQNESTTNGFAALVRADNGTDIGSGIVSTFFGISSLRAVNATIIGLDTALAQFKGLQILGNYTLGMELIINGLEIYINIEADRDPLPTNSSDGGTPTTEPVQFGFNTSGATFQSGLLVALDIDKFGAISIGSIMRGNDAILSCLSSALFDDLQITGFDSTSLAIEAVSVDGLRSPGMDRIMTTALEFIFAALESKISDIVSNSVAGVDLLSFILGEVDVTDNSGSGTVLNNRVCPGPVNGTNGEFIDFRDLFLPSEQAVEYGGSGTEPYGNFTSGILSKLLPALSDYRDITISGVWYDYVTSFELGKKATTKGNGLKFILSDFRFSNDGLSDDSSILGGVNGEANQINNYFSTGETVIGSNILFGLKTSFVDFRMSVDFAMSFEAFSILLKVLAKVKEDEFLGFSIENLLNIHCWLSLFPAREFDENGVPRGDSNLTLSVLDLAIAMQGLTLNVSCIECSDIVTTTITRLSSFNYTPAVTFIIESMITILNFGEPSLLQRQLDNMITDAPVRCPQNPAYNSSFDGTSFFDEFLETFAVPESVLSNESDNYFSGSTFYLILGVLIAGLAIALVIFLVNWTTRAIVAKRFHKMIGTLPEDEVFAMVADQAEEARKQKELDLLGGSLFTSKVTPPVARWMLPGLMLAASGFYWSGLFSPSIGIKIFVMVDGESELYLMDIAYSLAGFAGELWSNGARSIAVLCVLSVVWPQIRVLSILFLWFIPSSTISVVRRGVILMWLDILGKWSLIVVFILVINNSIFQGRIETQLFSIEYVFIPIWGMFAIILGQVISEVTCKLAVHYHKNIVSSWNKDFYKSSVGELPGATESVSMKSEEMTDSRSRRCALWKSKFTRPHRREHANLQIRRSVQYAFPVVCMLVIAMVLVGSILPSFTYSISGFLGSLIENTGRADSQQIGEHSVLSIVTALMASAGLIGEGKFFFSLGLICAFLIVTVIVMPIAEVLILLVQWIYPLEESSLKKLQLVLNILESWQCSEVYFVAVVATAVQLREITDFFTQTFCKTLTNLLRSLVYWGFLDEGGDQCVGLESDIHWVTLSLIFVPLMLFLLRTFIMDAMAHRSKDEDLKRKGTSRREFGSEERDTFKQQVDSLRPDPVHFTDRFRWVLRGEE